MYMRLTDRARMVLRCANQEAKRSNHEEVGTGHMLLGLLKEGSGLAAVVLKSFDLDLRKIRIEVEKLLDAGAVMITWGNLSRTPRADDALRAAAVEAGLLNQLYIDTEHLLLGLLHDSEGVAVQGSNTPGSTSAKCAAAC